MGEWDMRLMLGRPWVTRGNSGNEEEELYVCWRVETRCWQVEIVLASAAHPSSRNRFSHEWGWSWWGTLKCEILMTSYNRKEITTRYFSMISRIIICINYILHKKTSWVIFPSLSLSLSLSLSHSSKLLWCAKQRHDTTRHGILV